ncbi:membrane protein [Halostagnicola larsenii XH-48]|uniref:Membrane protein n=1 Tax=Halostagnicola larsenii XH-48 TaxID=797299 RepID=W0JT53_9EURY|nr:hypothetical protein [Halostagnicola larsenii]AHG00203.1 membrane protein [Halostagnicola larsenii XH-48]
MKIRRPHRPPQFRLADSAQQIVGGFLLAGPFVVTEEVWRLADSMSIVQGLATMGIVFAIGYATLYKADSTRDPEVERELVGIPIRFISLMCVSFGSVTLLALLFDAPDTFLESGETSAQTALITFKAVSIGSIFSVVGAATADSVFSR